MDLKTAVSRRDRLGWDFLGIVSGFFGIRKYRFLILMLPLSSSMTSSLALFISLDRSPESLNEYEHCGHLLPGATKSPPALLFFFSFLVPFSNFIHP
jgi:hypothetical protein